MAMWKDYQIPDDVAVAIAAGVPRVLAVRRGEHVAVHVLATAAGLSVKRLLRNEEGDEMTDEEARNVSDALAVPASLLKPI